MTTFEQMMTLIDATHKDFAGQMADKADAMGWDKSDTEAQRSGERMVDVVTVLSLVGAELDLLKARLDAIENRDRTKYESEMMYGADGNGN